jgi:hypothetical protein
VSAEQPETVELENKTAYLERRLIMPEAAAVDRGMVLTERVEMVGVEIAETPEQREGLTQAAEADRVEAPVMHKARQVDLELLLSLTRIPSKKRPLQT